MVDQEAVLSPSLVCCGWLGWLWQQENKDTAGAKHTQAVQATKQPNSKIKAKLVCSVIKGISDLGHGTENHP